MRDKSIFISLAEVMKKNQQEILKAWVEKIMSESKNLISVWGEEGIKKMALDFLDFLIKAMPHGEDLKIEGYSQFRVNLENFANESVAKNVTPSECTFFIFSLKESTIPIFQNEYKEKVLEAISSFNRLIDGLGLYIFETYMKIKENIIKEQQKALQEISVPVVKVWEKILLVPLVGMLDSARTQLIMEMLLSAIENDQAKVAILDISGIPVVDSLVAKHIIRTVTAAKLMGAECIITGIRARISQTMVQLGVDLGGIITKTTLADGLKIALDLMALKIVGK